MGARGGRAQGRGKLMEALYSSLKDRCELVGPKGGSEISGFFPLMCYRTQKEKGPGERGGGKSTHHFTLLGKLSTVLFRGMDNVFSRPEAPTGNR